MTRVTTVSSGPRATTWTRSISPQPVTQGAVPSSRQPPSAGPARSCGGPGMSPVSAMPPRVRPWQADASHRSRSTAGVPSARVMTSRKCWIKTNVTARQPLASSSTTLATWSRSSPSPPASTGAGAPYSPAAASASRCSAGSTSRRSTRIASGNSTSSASSPAAARTSCAVRITTGTRRPRACPSPQASPPRPPGGRRGRTGCGRLPGAADTGGGMPGLTVARIALGCGNFGGVGSAPQFFGQGLTEDQALELMDAAWAAGIEHFDTADAYGGGRSEQAIGRWIRSRGVRPRLTTKTFNPMLDGADHGLAPDRIARQLRSSLDRLGVDQVDLYLAHDYDPAVPLAETLGAFGAAQADGLIGAYGVSNFDARQLAAALADGAP